MENKIEAHGVKGMKSTPWRKTFKTVAALNAWVEKNDAEVYATSGIEEVDDDSELPQAARKMWA